MFQTNLSCYLWDLVDEGIDSVLDRVKGEAGVTGICVPVHCPPVCQLRPHRLPEGAPRTFRSAGGTQFQPDPRRYAGSRVRPVVAGWLRKANPLAAVGEGCGRRGLKLRAAIACCHSPVTVERYPIAAVKDAFGDADPHWLCPVNPDVREYLRGLVEDICSNYPLDAIELSDAGFRPPRLQREHEKIGVDPGPVGAWLRSLCFCESCRQAASCDGIDAAAGARSAAVRLEKLLGRGEPEPLDAGEVLDDDPVLAAYVDWQSAQVVRLISLLKSAAAECRLVVRQPPEPLRPAPDAAAIAAHCDALLLSPEATDGPDVETVVAAALSAGQSADRIELGLHAGSPACPDAAALVRSMARAAALGIRSASISNYGLIPLSRLEWIHQGARYARRESAGG